NFRNRVIHQGYIPSANDATEYGNYVLAFIFRTLIELKKNSSDAANKATWFHLSKNRSMHPEKSFVGTASIPTIVNLRSLPSNDFGKTTFAEALVSISKNTFYQHFYRKKA